MSVDGSADRLYWANEVLRAILYMAGPPDSEALLIPGFEPFLHELLLGAIHKKLAAIDQIILSEYDGDTIVPAMVILLRLLHFTLGFRGTWGVKAKEEGTSISKILFRFVLVRVSPRMQISRIIPFQKTSAGSDYEISLYPMILDTLYYLLDGPCYP